MSTSINGWEVINKQTSGLLGVGTIPGTRIKLRMRKEVLPLFLALAADYNTHVAPLRPRECGAYAFRKARQGGGLYSDHSSGTAVDLNWGHEGAMGPNGGMKTMTAKQIAACAAIKQRYHIVIWGGDKARGGDYASPFSWDPMHYALKPGTTVQQIAAVCAQLGIKSDGMVGDKPTTQPVIARLLRRPVRPKQ